MIRVLVADDHAVVRRGVIQILDEDPLIQVTAESAHSDEVLDLVRAEPPDVLVLDLNMPGAGGMEIIGQLTASHPELPILVLSMHDEQQYGLRVLKAGAAGYVMKNAAPDLLVGAVKRVAGGKRYMSAALAETVLDRMTDGPEAAPHEALSDREFQVFEAIAGGESVSEIAARLSLSVKTISTYRTRVAQKLGVGSNAEIARYAVENGLI